jgi:hypothetical protein
MRESIGFFVAAAAIAAAVVSTAMASTTPPAASTIEQCATLLPPGRTFSFELTGTIDTTGPVPKLSGQLSVSDATLEDSGDDGAAFGECLGKLIR